MKITLRLAFHEQTAVSLLNWLAWQNAQILRERPDLPGLYDSGVVYRRERDETWCDYLSMLAQGWEDCDGLAAARAGELMARGWAALGPEDGGYTRAQREQPARIQAEVFLRTGEPVGRTGLYHCVVRYKVGRRWYRDDPSARLGMYGDRKPPENPFSNLSESALRRRGLLT